MTTATAAPRLVDVLFPGGGETGALVRSIDWQRTPLGPVERWAPSLRTTVSVVLGATTPVFVFWGPHHVQLYNDAYRPILGSDKHPTAMGAPGRSTWGDVWDVVGPQIERTYNGDTWAVSDGQRFLERNGVLEEAFFNSSYTPVRDERGEVAGLYNTCGESTAHVLGSRRLALVSELSLQTSLETSVDGVLRTAQALLGAAPADVPFALVYGIDDDGAATLVSCTGLASGTAAAPARIAADDDPWGVLAVGDDGSVDVDDVRARFGDVVGGAWPEPVRDALLVPLPGGGRRRVLVLGMSPRLAADDDYRSFLRLLGRTLAASLAVTHALEHEARSKDDFLAMLGHELRNPLAPVVSALHLARRQPGLSPAVGRQLDIIERQTTNLTRIVDDLLDVSRISRGRVVLQNSDIDLADVVRAAVDAVASALATREQTLTVSLPSRPLPVHGDPVRLEQVVVNLLTNASTYSDVGGRIAVTVSLDDHTVTVAVDDDGIGIAAATLPHVFELFHQAERSLDRSQGGLGIGLTVVKQLVELHGGRVGARSAGPGKGSTFHITLPLQAPSPVVAPSTTTASASLSVLVVDDNIDAANALAELLELWEHEVQVAFDGSSALRLAGDTAFDVIILDIGLPDVDGYEVATRLRARESTSRIVALTGYGQAADKARARAAGFDEHLVKPVMPKALEAVLRRAEPRSA